MNGQEDIHSGADHQYDLGITALFIEPGSSWENGYIESFNGKLRDELLNRGGLRDPAGSAGVD